MKFKNLKVLAGAFTLSSLVLAGCNSNENEKNINEQTMIENTIDTQAQGINTIENKDLEKLEEEIYDLECRVEELDDEIEDLEEKRQEILIRIDTLKEEKKIVDEPHPLVVNNKLLKYYDDVIENINLNDQFIKSEEEFNYVLDRITNNRKKINTKYEHEILILNIPEFEDYSDITKQKFNKFLIGLDKISSFKAKGLKLTDISFLENTDIYNLELSNNEIDDIDVLSSVKDMAFLYLDNNKIKDLSPLKEQTRLEMLNLDCNNITDLSELDNLQYLFELNLSNNNVSDLTPLTNLVRLRKLILNNNNISDISALSKLYLLHWIEFEGNDISDVSSILSIIERNDTYITFTDLSDENINIIRSVRDEDDCILLIKR